MKEFNISERFRLEIHWDKASYNTDGEVYLEGCYLSGPVLREVASMNDEDNIKLDFVKQYVIFIKSFYITALSWTGVKRITNKIYLDNVTLSHSNLNVLPKLKNRDYIIVDTKNHEDEKHNYNMNYTSYLAKEDGTLYDFGEY